MTATAASGLRKLVGSSRPVSWINTAYPFGAAYLMAGGGVDLAFVVGCLYFLVPYNLLMYGLNDVFDYESDLRNPRKGGIEGVVLDRRWHRATIWAAVLSNLPFLAVLVALGSAASTAVLAVSVAAVVAYSAPVLRFKEHPLLDSATSSTHFVSPAIVGLTAAGAQFTPELWLILIAFFCWGMAAHAFGAVQDVIPDREARIGSIATVLGAASTVRLALALWALAGALMLFTPFPGSLAAAVAIPYLVNCAPYARVSDADSGRTNRAWRRFIWLNYASGAAVTMILIGWWLRTA